MTNQFMNVSQRNKCMPLTKFRPCLSTANQYGGGGADQIGHLFLSFGGLPAKGLDSKGFEAQGVGSPGV